MHEMSVVIDSAVIIKCYYAGLEWVLNSITYVFAHTKVEKTSCSCYGRLVIGYGVDQSHVRELFIESIMSRAMRAFGA